VDPGDERLSNLFEALPPQPSCDELGKAFVGTLLLWGMKNSMPMRIFPGQEIRFDLRSGMIMVGTMSITPSGSG